MKRLIKGRYELQNEVFRDTLSRTFEAVVGSDRFLVTQYDPRFTSEPVVYSLIETGNRWLAQGSSAPVPLVDFHFDGQSFFAMYAINQSYRLLLTALQSSQGLSMDRLSTWSLELLRQLSHLESHGVFHGNLCLHTIIIGQDHSIALIHAGLHADVIAKNVGTLQRLESGIFLTPDQLSGKPASIQSDIYGFGIVAYLFFSNKWPYEFTTEIPRLASIAGSPPRPFGASTDSIPSYFSTVITNAINTTPPIEFYTLSDLHRAFSPVDFQLKDIDVDPPNQAIQDVVTPQGYSISSSQKKALIIGGLLLVVGLVINYVYVSYVTSIPEIQVPDVHGLSLNDAQSAIESAHLRAKVSATRADYSVPDGTVIESRPSAGRHVKQNRIVLLTIAKYSATLTMPDLVGRKVDDVASLLPNPKTKVSIVGQEFSMTAPEGEILSQSPSAGVTINANSAVRVTVSQGFPLQVTAVKSGKKYTISIQASVSSDWPEQDIKVNLIHGSVAQTVFSKRVNPGENIQTSATLDLSDTVSVLYSGQTAIKKTVKQLVEESND